MSPRTLDWADCVNVRDVGGLPATGGKTRVGALVRSDSPWRLVESGRRSLVAYGVRTIVDLRSADEVERNPIDPPGGVVVRNVPAFGDVLARDMDEVVDTWPAAEAYADHLERFRPHFTAAVRTIADADEGGVLVACHAGRDRTGVVVALALALAGVRHEAIVADYAASMAPFTALARHQGPEAEAWFADFHARGWAGAPTMEASLRLLDERWGGAEGYVGDETVARRLRGRLLATA